LHMLSITTGNDIQIASKVSANPPPTWSQDAQHLVYSSRSHIFTIDMQNARISRSLKLQGIASTLIWSPASSSQLVVALSKGLYLVDTQHDTSIQLDSHAIASPIIWTQIP
jgi:Tol biopolymer transport system component